MMKIFALCLGCLLVPALGFAQKPESFDEHVADYRLLLSKKVQAEVGITAVQRANLNKAADRERAIAQPYLQQLQKEGKDARVLQNDQKYRGFLMDLRHNVLAQLTPSQLKRLRELSLQSVDLGGVLDVVVSKRIGMSADQLTKARAIYNDAIKRTSAISKQIEEGVIAKYKNMPVKTEAEAKALNARLAKDRQDAIKQRQPELERIENQTKGQLKAVLTAKQLAAYHALQGKPFHP